MCQSKGGPGLALEIAKVYILRTMKKILSLLVSAILFASTSITALASFRDVNDSTPYSSSINYIEQINVYNEENFFPTQAISRAEYAKWILRASGFTSNNYRPKTKVRFSDVPLNGKKVEQAPYIYKLIDIGVLKFTDFKNSEFKPESNITKKDALSWLFSLEGVAVPKVFDEENFTATDVDINSSAAPIVNKALQLEMFEPGKVDIYSKLTRGLAASFIEKIKNNKPVYTVRLINGNDGEYVGTPEYDTFVGAWNLINKSYLRKSSVKKDQLMYAAIEGMVKELGDKHTTFERPGDNGVVQTLSGQVEGIGAVLNDKEGDIVVVTPIVGSPAEKAGLLPNDIIREVDGVSVKDMALNFVVMKIKGKKGTQVKIKVQRGKDYKTFTITRDVVIVKSVETEKTDDGIFIIRVSNFGQSTAEEFNEALQEFAQSKYKGVIIDLRYNPGGYLHIVDEMAGHFIPPGQTVTTVRYPDHSEVQNSNGQGEMKGKKIVVLVNSGSASASEILAGALQDYKIATIVGEVTYGKGTVQELDDFRDGALLKLTIAEWLTPLGKTIDGKGITPDIIVKNPTSKGNQKPVDEQMARAKAEILK